MTDLYLIAHKVRGEPAFDVAERLVCPVCQGDKSEPVNADWEHQYECNECDDVGYWWIIPTSGHRARPYWHASLGDCTFSPENNVADYITMETVGPMPQDWPDHYAINDRPLRATPEAIAKGKDLLAKLGLARPKPKIERRF